MANDQERAALAAAPVTCQTYGPSVKVPCAECNQTLVDSQELAELRERAAERERWAARIEAAYREGFAARETYNDMDVNNVDEEWAKAKASLLRPNA